jgi:predicted RNA-binding protein with PUA-like domain
MQYWLMKSEPNEYSIEDLERDKREHWDGVRNYQARNFMRDDMKVGDIVFFYHSNTKPMGIYGLATVCSEPYADPTAFDKKDKHFDPKSKKESPTWILVDVCFKKKFDEPITLEDMKQNQKLEGFRLLQRGNRLSVFPVDEKHAEYLLKLR